ncbi:MAG TPA: PEGA domain-containing protein, partial [Pyrinomonadaceae bacterium]|nr:PEGA domain-containing protein [Pyrinomonadaceae bacterium]
GQRNRNNTSGRIEVSTTPGGYPIMIDGQPAGETSTTVRLIDLPEGPHRVEIMFPNSTRWEHTFNILPGKKNCITLAYRPRALEIPHAVQSPCPYPVNISAPATASEGNIVTFTSDVAYNGPSGLSYTWTISPPSARIVSGAGTPTITVDSTGVGRQRLTAILVVDDGSGDRACRQRASASTLISSTTPPPVNPRRFDEFPSIAFDDDKARLDNLAIELQNNPGSTAYIIVYGGRTSRADSADRLGTRASQYLVGTRGIDASRVVVVNGGYRETNAFELWLVPQGATPPQPTPTVQPGDVRPVLGAPRRGRRRG